MTVVLGALAAVMFGVGDLVAGIGGRKDGSASAPVGVAFIATSVAAVLSGLYVFVFSDVSYSSEDVWWALAAAVFMSAARPLLYRGMMLGPIVIFSPVFALVALIVPSLLGLIAGQSLAALEIVGVVIAVPAVVLIASERRLPKMLELRSSPVLGKAAFGGALAGLSGLFLSFINEDAGAAPAFAITAVGIVVIPVMGRIIGLSVRLTRTTVTYGSIVGCTSVVAFILASITYQRGGAAVGSALVGLAPGVSIILAWKLLKERVWPIQLAGGLCAVATVMLFALAA